MDFMIWTIVIFRGFKFITRLRNFCSIMGFPTSRRWGSFSPLFLFIWVLCNGASEFERRKCGYTMEMHQGVAFLVIKLQSTLTQRSCDDFDLI
ncbi:hypothetical protein QQP08_001674 [Theobroma cacao]|nr:hypothetical protein QQP08_001674 [Theobroma cacao]